MESLDSYLISIVSFFTVGLVLLNIISFYAKKTKLFPDVIWTLLLGILYGSLSLLNHLNIPHIELEPHFIFYVLVPILIFAASKKMCLFHFRKVLKEASILATAGVIFSAVLIALPLSYFFNIPFEVSLLFGIIISATDPIAVNAIINSSKQLNIHQKMLIEGESILNDGIVVALFSLLLVVILTDKINFVDDIFILILKVALAVILGIILGRIARVILNFWNNSSAKFTINITIALAFSSFLFAEYLHLPGILVIFVAALAFGYKRNQEDKENQLIEENVWEYLEYIANHILFFLLGASFFSQVSIELITITLIIFGFIILLSSRVIMLTLFKPLIKLENKTLTKKDFWVLNLSGSRGAISIALILLLPETFEFKQLFLALGFIIVILSLVIYPIILKKFLANQSEKQ